MKGGAKVNGRRCRGQRSTKGSQRSREGSAKASPAKRISPHHPELPGKLGRPRCALRLAPELAPESAEPPAHTMRIDAELARGFAQRRWSGWSWGQLRAVECRVGAA